MRGRGVGADTGWSATSGKAVGVVADGGDSACALAASGGVFDLLLCQIWAVLLTRPRRRAGAVSH